MRSPLLPLRGSRDSAALLDRGGRPTLRELLSGLEFDAATGALRLNGERVTLQLAEADRILRRELVRLLGEDEARVFLLRRGFRMGLNDAAFVSRSWPMLDRGDAFTAGTRLHQFSGVVRVETMHNDFDFARGRFSAEFLWHNSIEAEAGDEPPRLSDRPVCWQQLGYASGYASHFFGSLVVYKETECAAQGHRCCRVVGRLATGWGDDDPDVMLFRSRIMPPAPSGRPRTAAVRPEQAEALVLGPILGRLERAARLPLPCLIAGTGSCGQDEAARHLIRLAGQPDGITRLHSRSAGTEALRTALAPSPRPGRKETPPILLIEEIEALPPEAQATLAQALAEGDALTRPRLVATAGRNLAELAAGAILSSLWARLAPLAMELPALRDRCPDLAVLAGLRLERLARGLALDLPEVLPGAWDELARNPPGAGLDGLDALLTALLVAAMDGQPISDAMVAAELARVSPAAPQRIAAEPAGNLDAMIAQALARGDFSLQAHEARIRAMAIERTGGNLSAAARLLGISRAQLAYREGNGRSAETAD